MNKMTAYTRSKKAKILIVDDNAVNVALLEELLDEADYTHVTGITDSRKVIPMLIESNFDIDLIILDIRMPHLNGFEVLKLLSETVEPDNYLPVLVLTAESDRETRKTALAAGAKDFLAKPFLQWEVLLRIQNMLEARMFYKAQRQRADLLDAQVRLRTREIQDTQIEILRRLGQAAEFRDNETGGHIMRMSHYSQILALAAGFTPQAAEMLLIASPMHDVGKIAIPDHVLLKPGKLTPEEFEIIKTHPYSGFKLLDGHSSDLMKLSAKIALSHHEKWDGTGYPHALQGEQIPVEGRIVALADVFDALTSERPYKKPWTVEAAVEYITEQSGKHFDPKYVQLFIENLDKIIHIKKRFADHPTHTNPNPEEAATTA